MQNRLFIIALSASLLLHGVVFLVFLNYSRELEIFYPPTKDSQRFTNVTYVKLSTPKISNNFTPSNKPIQSVPNHKVAEPMSEPVITPQKVETPTQKEAPIIVPQQQQKPIEQPKELPKESPKHFALQEKIEQPKELPKESPKHFALQEKRELPEPTSLNNFLLSKEKATEPDETTKSYIKLYGDEFYNFDAKTKQFLVSNLSKIGAITQKHLKYPTISIKTKQQGMNMVEFMLHPNGDITDLKLISSSTYSALDQNSLRTIQIAYKDYPKPSSPTKIKIYVNYIYGVLY